MRLLVVGGSDAGISAALRARELDPTVEVTVLVADRLRTGGDRDAAAAGPPRPPGRPRHPAGHGHQPHGHKHALGYDRLIVGTGAVPVRPPIPGLDLPGVHLLHSMADVFKVQQALQAGRAER